MNGVGGGQDQQPEATFKCLMQTAPLFTYSFTICRSPFFLPLPAAATNKTAATPDVVQLTGTSTALPALLLCSLFQCTL